jgi:hypothetical protein
MDSRYRKITWSTLLIWLLCTSLAADEGAREANPPGDWDIAAWNVQFSVYTKHFDPDPEHVNRQNLIGLESIFENNWLAGLAVFDNSFGQNSQFLYVGKSWPLLGSEHWYVKLMGGLLHGYKEPYEDKIPLNGLGIAPAIVPSLGFKYKWFRTEANLGGLSVITITAGFSF